MSNTLTHKFASQRADSNAGGVVQPSHWNAEHLFSGGLDGQTMVADGSSSDGVVWKYPGGAPNVKDYGAVGDGVHDDTLAIQAAIDDLPLNTANAPYFSPSLAPNGGRLIFPRSPDGYKITAPILLSRGVMIEGEGSESTRILSFSDSGVFVYQPPDGGGYVPDLIGVRGLSIWQDASVTATSGAGVFIRPPVGPDLADARSVRLYVEDVIVEGTYYGVAIGNTIAAVLRNMLVSKTVRHGVYVQGPAVWYGSIVYVVGLQVVSNGNVYECITAGTTAAAGGVSGTDSDITDGTCHWKYISAHQAGSTVSTALSCENVYTFLSQTGDGFHLEAAEYCALRSCASDSHAGFGYVLHRCVGTHLSTCGSEQNGAGGALLFRPLSTVITGLRVVEGATSIGYTNPCTRHGVILQYAENTALLGCVFTGTDGVEGYAVYIVTTGPWFSVGQTINGTYFGANSSAESLSLTPGLEGLGIVMTTDTAAPTTGSYLAGSRVFNAAPAVGQPKGWICTVTGTPGTWVSEGDL